MSPHILAVRALNETRLLHPPTYVATRYLLESIAANKSSSWTEEVVTRYFSVEQKPRLFQHQRFKKIQEDGQLGYREFFAPSPLTCLAEAFILGELGKSEASKKPRSIYSHLWPTSIACPYNFDHYAGGYKRRNRDISRALRDNPGCVALVTDIERFYPSISQKRIRSRWLNRISAEGVSVTTRKVAIQLFDHVASPFPDGKGIATGPELSHVLGDIALLQLDQIFGERYPGRYFRYVDDIVLVVSSREEKEALHLLQETLFQEGLSVNTQKTDRVSDEDWNRHGPNNQERIGEESFEALVFRLKIYLARHPGKFSDLKAALRDEGFSLPLERLQSASVEEIFRNKVKGWFAERWGVLLHCLLDSEDTLIEYAKRVRNRILGRLRVVAESETPRTSTLRRWRCQRIRYLVNRMLYLVPPSELGFVQEFLEEIPEFAETVALLKLLRTGNPTALLEMPGPAVAAAASLFRSSGKTIQMPNLTSISAAGVHSVAVLSLYGVMEMATMSMAGLEKDDFDFLSFCRGEERPFRMRDDFGYLDEILSLCLNRKSEERLRMLDRRFYGDEPPILEALEIGEEYYV